VIADDLYHFDQINGTMESGEIALADKLPVAHRFWLNGRPCLSYRAGMPDTPVAELCSPLFPTRVKMLSRHNHLLYTVKAIVGH